MSKSIRICGNSVPSEVFEWLAKGEQVQVNIDTWTTCSTEGILRHLLSGTTHQFRLKPRTVKIGNREIEAPVLVPAEGQTLWWYDSGADEPIASEPSASEAARGEWFASASAATAAYEAFMALLRGEA